MKVLVLVVIIIILALGGFFYLKNINKTGESRPSSQTSHTIKESSQSSKTITGYQGKVLAGSQTPFLEFNRSDYGKALTEGKIIVLDFYANWCPICRAEEPVLLAGFDGLSTDKVIGFRVNYNDSKTDSDEKYLAKQFNITYQHTKVILRNGQEYSRSLESWNKEKFDTEVSKALQ